MKKTFLIAILSLTFIFSGCQDANQTQENQEKTGNSETGQIINIPNPASKNCIDKGGKLEIRNNKKGDYGVCLFEGNRQCEERALFRGECPEGGLKITGYENEAQTFCAIAGGKVEGVGTTNPMCKRVDGTICNVQANFDGECSK